MTGYGVAILMALVHMLAVGDRFLLSILIEPIKADLALRDGMIGVLQGPAFAVLNGLAIVPMTLLARRWPLARLLAVAMLGSSVATIACGLAGSGEAVAAARMVLGLVQAAIGPAALGLIVAAMTPTHRGRGISLFTAGAALGRGLAMIGAGRCWRCSPLFGFRRTVADGVRHGWCDRAARRVDPDPAAQPGRNRGRSRGRGDDRRRIGAALRHMIADRASLLPISPRPCARC
ncbi:MFS transporter [Sphingomonas sp. I4]